MDDRENLEMMRDYWAACDGTGKGIHELTLGVLSKESIWGEDLAKKDAFARTVGDHLYRITCEGVKTAIEKVL